MSLSDEKHCKIVKGMIFGILCLPSHKSGGLLAQNKPLLTFDAIFMDLRAIVRDNFDFATEILKQLVGINFDNLRQLTVERLVWLSEHLLAKGVSKVAGLFIMLLERISASSNPKVVSNLENFIKNYVNNLVINVNRFT